MSDAGGSRERAERAAKATRRRRTGTRATGTNPRAKGTNPRSVPPTIDSPAGRLIRMRRQAMARLHTGGEHWCYRCDDTGWRPTMTDAGDVCPCVCAPMSYGDAWDILHPEAPLR